MSAVAETLALPASQILQLPVPDYDADRSAVRKSWLDLIDQSPAHLNAYLIGARPHKNTDALFKGTLIHAVILEPDTLTARYYTEPEGDGRTKAVKDARAEAAAKNVGKLPVNPSEWRMALGIRDAVYAHKAAKALLEADGDRERSLFWENRETGERCKARLDLLSQGKAFIADVKSTVDASPDGFGRSIVNYRYDVQAHHYREALELRFCFIAVEKDPPYAVAVYADNPEIIKRGAKHRLPNLRAYAECKASGRWPCYPETIQHIRLPGWAYR